VGLGFVGKCSTQPKTRLRSAPPAGARAGRFRAPG
jgi:hypothetical protein